MINESLKILSGTSNSFLCTHVCVCVCVCVKERERVHGHRCVSSARNERDSEGSKRTVTVSQRNQKRDYLPITQSYLGKFMKGTKKLLSCG